MSESQHRTLIMVCGANRSGTTMLDLMLGNAPNAFSCGESYNWFRPTRRNHFILRCATCSPSRCSIWETLKTADERQFHQTIFSSQHVDFVIDSSKNLCWVLDSNIWARQDNLLVNNVLIWKHPGDHAFSFVKRGRTIDEWQKHFVDYYGKFLALGIPFWSISYEALVSDPATYLRQICDSIDMPYFPGKESFWIKAHHHVFGSGGTRKQLRMTASSIKPTCRTPEFQRVSALVENRLRTNGALRDIVERLRQLEIRSASKQCVPRLPTPIVRPAWYYYRMFKSRIRKQFPAAAVPGSMIESYTNKRQ